VTGNDSVSAINSILDSFGSQFTDVSGQQLLCFRKGAELLKSGIYKGGNFTERQKVMTLVTSQNVIMFKEQLVLWAITCS
jgi:hypothetical protein